MATNPLEYIVMGCPGNQFMNEIAPALSAIQARGVIQVVDLLFFRKDSNGTVTVLETADLDNEELAALDPIKDSLIGLITPEDIVTLSETVPADTSAVIILLEHLWVGVLGEAVQKANGTVFSGGVVSPEAREQVAQELAAGANNASQSQAVE